MALSIPSSHGISQEEVADAGGFVAKKGSGHFFLEASAEKELYMALHFVCLAHEAEENVGKKYIERLYFASNNENTDPKELWKRILYWAWKLDIVSEAEIASGEALELDFQQAVDACAHCVLFLHDENFTDKGGNKRQSVKADYKGIFRIDDPIVVDKRVPLHEESLIAAGIEVPTAAPAGKAASNGAKAAPAAKTAPPAARKPVPARKPQPAADDLGDV